MREKVIYPVTEAAPLLEFLLAHVTGQSRNSVKHLLSRNQILVEGKVQKQFDLPLTPGQSVTVLPYPAGPELPFPVLYEDDGLIVINKPAGLLSVGNEKEKERTAYRKVRDHLKAQDPKAKLFVVHRLDRDTSGVLLFAKDPVLKDQLQENWNATVKARKYLAIVEGKDIDDSGVCRSKLTENRVHRVYATKHTSGKEAITRYTTLARKDDFALLDVSLETGRKNQIRSQLSELGHPVAGDEKYGAETDPLGRLALHACELSLTDPRTQKVITFTAPVPVSFTKLFPRKSWNSEK